MITLERRDKALTYLVETDEECARAKALMQGLDKQEKTVLAVEIMKTKGATAQEREAIARSSMAYKEWLEKYQNSVLDYELLKNKRTTEETVCEMWRSENANRRAGNIT